MLLLVYQNRTNQLEPDAVQYCVDARAGESLFHPHHLLYTATLRYAWKLSSCMGLDLSLVATSQILSAVVTTILFYVFTVMCSAVHRSPTAGHGLGLLVIGTAAAQTFATQPESYILSLIPLVMIVGVAHSGVSTGITRIILPATLLAVATLYHQIHAIFCIPLLAGAVAIGGSRAHILRWSAITGLAAVATVIVYFVAYHAEPEQTASSGGIHGRSVAGFVAFCTRYAMSGNSSWGTAANVSIDGISRTGLSILRSYFGPMLDAPRWLSCSALLAIIALCAYHMWVSLSARAGLSDRERTLRQGTYHCSAAAPSLNAVRVMCSAWIIVYLGFIIWWLPEQWKYQMFVQPPTILLASLLLRDFVSSAARRSVVILATGTCLLAANYCTISVPAHVGTHRLRTRAMMLSRVVPRDFLLLCDPITMGFARLDAGLGSGVASASVPIALIRDELDASGSSVADPPIRALAASIKLAIPLAELNPRFAAFALDGDARPAVWMHFMTWLFDFRDEYAGGVGTARSFRVVATRDNEYVVLLGTDREAVESLGDMMQTLDSRLQVAGATTGHSFLEWYTNH